MAKKKLTASEKLKKEKELQFKKGKSKDKVNILDNEYTHLNDCKVHIPNIDDKELFNDKSRQMQELYDDTQKINKNQKDILTIDPFNLRPYSDNIKVKIVADFVRSKLEADEFHTRELYYAMLNEKICLPHNPDYFEGKILDKPNSIFFNGYGEMTKALQKARYLGLIKKKIVDKRVIVGIKPDYDYLKKSSPDSHQIELNHSLGLNFSSIKPEVDSPVIVIVSEKSEIGHIVEKLAEKYIVSYYIGNGQISITAAQDIYKYIKKHGKAGVILTCNDFDESGYTISSALARKIQFFQEKDDNQDDVPAIIFYHWMMTFEQADLISKYLAPIMKKSKLIYELSALQVLVQNGIYKSLFEFYDKSLQNLFVFNGLQLNESSVKLSKRLSKNSLISHTDYNKFVEFQEDDVKKSVEIQAKKLLNTGEFNKEKILENLGKNSISKDNSIRYENYLSALNNRIKNLESYSLLQKAVKNTKYKTKDIIFEGENIFNTDSYLEKYVLMKDTEKKNRYGENTKMLSDFVGSRKIMSDYLKTKTTKDKVRLVETSKEDVSWVVQDDILNIIDDFKKPISKEQIIKKWDNLYEKTRGKLNTVGEEKRLGAALNELEEKGKIVIDDKDKWSLTPK